MESVRFAYWINVLSNAHEVAEFGMALAGIVTVALFIVSAATYGDKDYENVSRATWRAIPYALLAFATAVIVYVLTPSKQGSWLMTAIHAINNWLGGQ